MRFDLEHHVVLFVEPHYAGVVAEHADAPIAVAQPAGGWARGGKNRFLEHVVEPPLAASSR